MYEDVLMKGLKADNITNNILLSIFKGYDPTQKNTRGEEGVWDSQDRCL